MRKVIPLEQHVVLLADNQSSRATARGALETHKMIKSQYNASWFFIPPHSSAVLQPMDRVFQTLHQKFNMHRGMLMEEGGFRRMSIAQCARMVPEVLHAFFAAVEGQGMRGAWSRCGVGPRHLDVDLVHPGDLRHDDAGAASAPPPAKRVGGTAQLVALHAILKEERKAKIARVFDVPERRGRPAGKGHVKGQGRAQSRHPGNRGQALFFEGVRRGLARCRQGCVTSATAKVGGIESGGMEGKSRGVDRS